ncbi:MAG: helix-turn-helix domain-containing protein [Verrucomicrobiaceae bacterium]|jgi:DNA-binding transcriptional regulator YiaG|nr:helix-turn-helix domain-containing protein [Verrucomicrobiaceae bacterium]
MKKKTQEVEFDPQALVERVKAFAAHAKSRKPMPNVRITQVAVPPKLKPLPAADIKRIRTHLGVSQATFAALLNVPRNTAISWENGVRKPSGAALKLLSLVRQKPEILAAAG